MSCTALTTRSLPRRFFSRGRTGAAIVASLAALGCAGPVAAAAAESQPELNAALSVRGEAQLLNKVTLPQLAALLHVTPAELVAQLDGLPGAGEVLLRLNTLLGQPGASLQSILDELTANGLNPGPVEGLIQSLLSRVLGNSAQFQSFVTTLLADLGIDGQLGTLAHELGVTVSALEGAKPAGLGTGELAAGLSTTVEGLGNTFTKAGSITVPLSLTTPVVVAPVQLGSDEGTTELVGLPNGQGGITLTTLNVTTPVSGAAAGSTPSALASNAFSIVSIKLSKSGLIIEKVKLPGPGRLAIGGTATATLARSAGRGRGRAVHMTVAVTALAASVGSGVRTITLRPHRSIRSANRVVLSIATTYKPMGGSANTQHRTVTVTKTHKKK